MSEDFSGAPDKKILGCSPAQGNFTGIIRGAVPDNVYYQSIPAPRQAIPDDQLNCRGAGPGAVDRCIEQYSDAQSNASDSPWFSIEYRCGDNTMERVDKSYDQVGYGNDAELDCREIQERCLGGQIRLHDSGLIQFVHVKGRSTDEIEQTDLNGKLYPWKDKAPETIYSAASDLYKGKGEVVTGGEAYTVLKIDAANPQNSGILENGDFIGSPSGNYYLKFVYEGSVGKLVAFNVEPACQPEELAEENHTMTSRLHDVRAPYRMKDGLSSVDKANEMLYVDTYDRLRFFDQPSTALSESYYNAGKYDMGPDVVPLKTLSGEKNCKKNCNELEACYGYVQDDEGCKLYGADNMYPASLNRVKLDAKGLSDAGMFVRLRKTINETGDCSKEVKGAPQSLVAGNVKGSNLKSTSACRIAEYTQNQVAEVKQLNESNKAALATLGNEANRMADGNIDLEKRTDQAVASQEDAERSMNAIIKQRAGLKKTEDTVYGMDESSTSEMLSNNYNMLLWTSVGIASTAVCMYLAR